MGNTEFNKVIKSYVLWGFSEPLKYSHTTDPSPRNSFVHREPHRTSVSWNILWETPFWSTKLSRITFWEIPFCSTRVSRNTLWETPFWSTNSKAAHEAPQETEKDEQCVLVKILTTCSLKREKNSSGVCPFPWCEYFHRGLLEATNMTSMNKDLGREHTLNARTLLTSGEQKQIPSGESGGQKESSLH